MKAILLLFTVFLLQVEAIDAQVQKGIDIDGGEGRKDFFGHSVHMSDPNTIAVSAINSKFNTGKNEYEFDKGYVKVYRWIEDEWVQKGDRINDILQSFRHGHSVYMADSNNLIIGTIKFYGYEKLPFIKVYKWNGDGWVKRGSIENDELNYIDNVRMPNTNTIGIFGIDSENLARVYSWNCEKWVRKGYDIIIGKAGSRESTQFKMDMPDENTIAFVADIGVGLATDAIIIVYKWDGTKWERHSQIKQQGSPTAIKMYDANNIVVSTNSFRADNTRENGKVSVYRLVNDTIWIQRGKTIVGNGEFFGHALAMPDKDIIAVSDKAENGDGTLIQAGTVKVYKWLETGWTQIYNTIVGESIADESGNCISMPNVKTIAIGAHLNNGNGLSDAGHARVFVFCEHSDTSLSLTACNKYISPSGKKWTESGEYIDTIKLLSVCDSIVRLNLEIKYINVIKEGNDLVASEEGESYQWLDCTDDCVVLVGDTNKSISPKPNL